MTAKSEGIARAMDTPVETVLPPPASVASLDRAEAQLAFALPTPVRQLYGEVADGGFGPATGFMSIDRVVERRASYGLPEVGWERSIGGELGLDEDELGQAGDDEIP